MVLLASDDHARGGAEDDPERVRILEAAERLFYAHGLQQVGMDQVRAEAGVSLKRLYREFPSKDQLIEAYLVGRDARWLASLRTAVASSPGTVRTASQRILAAFDWLDEWFAEPGFRGCAFTNSFGELGPGSGVVSAIASAHKVEFRAVFGRLVDELASELGLPLTPMLGEQLYLLAEGAITAAGVTGDLTTARSARAAAMTLLDAAAGTRAEPGRSGGRGLFRRFRGRR